MCAILKQFLDKFSCVMRFIIKKCIFEKYENRNFRYFKDKHFSHISHASIPWDFKYLILDTS